MFDQGHFFQGGPRRDGTKMVATTALFRDEGGLPAEASLIFSQLLLNLGGRTGYKRALELVDDFLHAADVGEVY